jgi:hypothetical protein
MRLFWPKLIMRKVSYLPLLILNYNVLAKSDEALNLYAQSLMHANRMLDVYDLLKREGFERTGRTRFMFAKSAFELRK